MPDVFCGDNYLFIVNITWKCNNGTQMRGRCVMCYMVTLRRVLNFTIYPSNFNYITEVKHGNSCEDEQSKHWQIIEMRLNKQ